MGHRLRAKIQFQKIGKIKEWLKDDPDTRMLLMIDRKQKVLPMKHREDQVEYYGKTGMSILGAMEVQWIQRDNDPWRFQYSFVDYVIKGYSAQDNVQVCACVAKMVEVLTERHCKLKQICI